MAVGVWSYTDLRVSRLGPDFATSWQPAVCAVVPEVAPDSVRSLNGATGYDGIGLADDLDNTGPGVGHLQQRH
jgi:hypothetical protein